ncbi:MAG: helix-turn-helix transcriptional regulator, partial [Enterococcus faecalis]|nr:helix-turn-helix transcriptional regulator [Enterococcus faecalis]
MTVSIQHQFNGQRLKEARMYRGMTLEELKEKIGVSKQMISKYEQNISAPTPEILFS